MWRLRWGQFASDVVVVVVDVCLQHYYGLVVMIVAMGDILNVAKV